MQGLILVNKPKGITSFAAVARVRRLAGIKRVGHTGTLDPLAEGVLPILIGRATSLCSYITETEKSYTARVRLGITTDTEDITGNVLTEKAVHVTDAQLLAAAESFLGECEQIPPMFSAIKVDGKRLYSLARKGEEIERTPRKIFIKSITVRDFDGKEFYLDVTCGKGTYIRSLCRDIGGKLGCGATLTELIRTQTAGFSIENCVPLDDLTEENINTFILPTDKAVESMPQLNVTEKQAVRFSNGGMLDITRTGLKNATDDMLLRVKYNGVLLGIGRVEEGSIKVACVLNNKDGSD